MKSRVIANLLGTVSITVRGKSVTSFINALAAERIVIWNVRAISEDRVQLNIMLGDFYRLRPILKKTSCRMHVEKRMGFPFVLKRIIRRKLFAVGIFLFFVILYIMSSLVWDIEVKGNVKLTTETVLKAAKEEGIYPFQWVFRLKEQDKLSRELTQKLPGSSWVGVSVHGTRITIQVVEATIPEQPPLLSPRHIIAKSDAVVTQIFAEQGRPVVQKNTRVKKGSILISGILGDEGNQKLVVAKGVVKGLVWHEYLIEVPTTQKYKSYTGEQKERGYLVLGNIAIQLTGYGKLSFDKYETVTNRDSLTWRNIKLPVGWMTEKVMEMQMTEDKVTDAEARAKGLEQARKDVIIKNGKDSRIVSEKILHEKKDNGKVYMKVLFEVEENISEELPLVHN
ncbi:sporulation protein YqfD [Paenibacillus sediminis]|uniref:Sporulation protein YqfD n=1 Tax=Paenibacillus sediminis TaxID=664909 RepID=A0ABS4GYQ9_9BACL|nr:sporulation protein YqfD [Paenibacillus sediminis]MBP1935399.1 hypothetical protein [Paenibacillus sediminis]